MAGLFLFLGIVSIIIFSYIIRSKEFENSFKKQEKAFEAYNKIENGMTIEEVREIIGDKGCMCKSVGLCRWYFGDSIAAKKYESSSMDKLFISVKEFIDNYLRSDYYLKRVTSFIEVNIEDGKVISKNSVGLN